MKKSVVGIFTCLLVINGFAVSPAWPIDWDLKGSLVELNGFIPINDATATPFAFEGLDLVSIGGSEPSSVVTFAAGGRYKIMDHLIAGIASEFPLTDDEDILDWRLTADRVIYF